MILGTLVFSVAFLAGCASGPTPAQLFRQKEVMSNAPDASLTTEEIERANELLSSLNAAAGPYLQEDSSDLMFGATKWGARTWFLLDEATGKLTFQSSEGTRELMLRHVIRVETNQYRWNISGVNRSAFVDARGVPFATASTADTGTRYDVHLYTGNENILTNTDGRTKWKDSIVVLANDAAAADAIEASLRKLVDVYRE